MAESVTLVLTKDHAGVNLWRHRPKWCLVSKVYYNGGETLTLAEGAFAHLPNGSCLAVEIVPAGSAHEKR